MVKTKRGLGLGLGLGLLTASLLSGAEPESSETPETKVVTRYHYVPVPADNGACLCWSKQGCDCEPGQCRCGILCGCGTCGCARVEKGGGMEVSFWLPWWLLILGYLGLGVWMARWLVGFARSELMGSTAQVWWGFLGLVAWPLVWVGAVVLASLYLVVSAIRGEWL
jgi:hypothetical protein